VQCAHHDLNQAKWLVVYGDSNDFDSALRELEKKDHQIGEQNSVVSDKVMIRYLNVLITQKQEEIQDLISTVHRLYSSKRYRIGHLLINPIEKSIYKLFKRNS
jgi:hypothetical protein